MSIAKTTMHPVVPPQRNRRLTHHPRLDNPINGASLAHCSDGFEFTCWNGDVVRGAFIIDAHDREIIAWRAAVNAGISGSDIRDMMLEAVEHSFYAFRVPRLIEMLSDKGSPYVAKQTRTFAHQLGLKPCFTPIASPQSNGIAEAFVKTVKRDYVHAAAGC